MAKRIFLTAMLLMASLFLFVGCEKESEGTREQILIDIVGNWEIQEDDVVDGTIMFDAYESFMMESSKGTLYGNVSIIPNGSNVLSFYYVENEDGEEYPFDGFSEVTKIYTKDSIVVNNLPLYENKDVTLVRK